MTTVTAALRTLDEAVRLNDPHFHTYEAAEVFARLRREDPVHHHTPLDTWVLSRYDDVRHASRHPEDFSVAHGIRLDNAAGQPPASGMFADGGEFLAYTDPPRHTELRKVLAPAFTARAVAAREARIRDIAVSVVDRVEPGAVVDWVPLAARMPILVMLDLLGLPATDVDDVRRWSDGMERLSYPLRPGELQEVYAQFAPLGDYLREQMRRKRAHPGDDLTSLLVAPRDGGTVVTEANVVTFLQTVLGAGNDTTRSLLSGMVVELARRPDQLAALRADPGLVDRAVEEALRWITPARGFVRTVVRPTEIRGVALRPGQRVYLAYDSANRDEEVFADPDVFDVTVPRRQHASFGFGTHVCIGAAYARKEAAALLSALLRRFTTFELAGEPERVVAVLREGYLGAPVVFR
ncbi:cytochrome P450 [Streptosporangium sp. NPDC001681]|uniref:cytochrome P450 n=1 Tax=Streptosporangium sp. NPDC001681 TaxID=3154395 RepID=UPI0033178B13